MTYTLTEEEYAKLRDFKGVSRREVVKRFGELLNQRMAFSRDAHNYPNESFSGSGLRSIISQLEKEFP
jgi:hypothetical protein